MINVYDKYGNLKVLSNTGSVSETDPIWLADKPNYLTIASAASTYSLLSHTHTFSSITSKPTTLSGYGITDAQPLDSDLTAIAALTTDSFGRALLEKTTAANVRSYIGAGTGSGDALTTNPLSQFAATTSSQLAGVISDETGSGALVFATSPTLVTPILGVASGTSLVLGGTLGSSAIADFQSTTKGMLPPRMTTAQMNAIGSPVPGLTVFNTDEEECYIWNTTWGWESESHNYKRKYGWDYINEFIAPIGADGYITTGASGGSVTIVSGTTNHPGLAQLSTLASATGKVWIGQAVGATSVLLLLGGGKIMFDTIVRIPTLSTGSERFAFIFGLSSTLNSTTISNAVAFTYDEGGIVSGGAASANWQVATMAASSRSFTTTSVSVTANQFYRLTAIVNAAGTSVDFYIDGVLVKTETNNIPTLGVGIMLQIYKSIGTTPRTAEVDNLYIKQKFTTAR